MNLVDKVNALAAAVGSLIKGRQPLSAVLTDISGRTIGASSSNSLLDRAAGDDRYLKDSAISIVIDGGGEAITPGSKLAFSVPFAATIIGYDLFSDQTGSLVIDLKKSSYSVFPITSSIASVSKPALSNARKATGSSLTGWTTSIDAGDVIEVVVDSASTIQVATLVLKIRKT